MPNAGSGSRLFAPACRNDDARPAWRADDARPAWRRDERVASHRRVLYSIGVLDADEIRANLVRAFPDATVAAEDSTGAGDHFAVTVVSASFTGKTLVERHQMVYGALAALMPRIHALQLKTVTPGER